MTASEATSGRHTGGGLPRLHLVLLLVIAVVGLARGMFWVSVTQVFNPIDEGAHYAYVESMARHGRPPVVGRDRLSPGALEIIKTVRTSEWRPAPVPPSPDDPRWGAVRESYEGVQGPLYYALMVVPYRLSRPLGLLESLYAIRLATVLVSLLAVPIAYLLARELLPRLRAAWLGAPALLVLVQGFNGNLASITNDALVVPLAGLVLLAVSMAARRGLTTRSALVTGALVGLGLATKSNMVALVPVVGLSVVAAAIVRRDRWTLVLRWAAVAAAGMIVAVLPWLVWNLVQYHAVSASAQVDLITGPAQPNFPLSPDGVRRHLLWSTIGYWDFQLIARPLGRYMWVLFIAAAGLLTGAVAVALGRRRFRESATLAWLGSSWFLTLLTMLIVIYGVFGGHSSVIGRHIYPSLVAVVVLMAAAASIVAGRGGWVLLLLVANLALTFEQPLVHAYLDKVYTNDAVGDLVPAVEQSYGEGVVAAVSVRVAAPCPAEAIALVFAGPAPKSLPIVSGNGTFVVQHSEHLAAAVQGWDLYRLPAPTSGPLEVALGGATISASATDREPRSSLTNEPGDAVIRVYCPVDDPARERFSQLFSPDHPRLLSYGQVKAWPVVWAWGGRLSVLAVFAAAVLARRRRRLNQVPR